MVMPPSGVLIDVVHTLDRNVKRFAGGLVLKAHTLLYHSTLGFRVMKKRKKEIHTLSRRVDGSVKTPLVDQIEEQA